ncbi:MAG: AhpC/TSA family protein [Prevotellaceae bacterium]|jgi:peroxiredoxin|nr:AhpC/TSA family protein [Prevotellaceae bacterium]
MKRILLIIVAAIALYSCNSAPSYTIKGTVNKTDLEGAQVFLTLTENRETTNIDTATITNGAFELKGVVETPKIYAISINNNDEDPIRVSFILENAPITITIDENENKIGGTPTNDAFQQYQSQIAVFNKQIEDVYEEYKTSNEAGEMTPELEESLSAKLDEAYEKMLELQKQFAAANINNPAGQTVLRSVSYRLSAEELRTAISGADSTATQTDILKGISERIDALEKTAVGQKYTDLRYPNPDGIEVALSDYVEKNKVVLVDFWASWCGPCRRDMPNVVAAYKKYKNKGFEVVGVSLDRTKEAWVKGIEELNITWPQMSDIKYWDSEAAKTYAVNSIPHMMLIDAEGTIIARGIHGGDLDSMLNDLLK